MRLALLLALGGCFLFDKGSDDDDDDRDRWNLGGGDDSGGDDSDGDDSGGDDSGGDDSDDSGQVDNRAPIAPSVAITPGSPSAGVDALTCVTTGASDPDGDAITLTFTWTVDGAAYVAGGGTVSGGVYAGWTGPQATTHPGDTVPVEDTFAGQVWTCSVVVDDGRASSGAVEASATVDDPALVADWPLDGGDATDASGNGHDGSVYQAAFTTGQVGGALSFDGVDDHVRFGNDAAFDLGGAGTIAAWVRSDDPAPYGAVLSKRSCCDDADDLAWSLQNNAGSLDFGVYTEGAQCWAGQVAWPVGAWSFVVGVYDGESVTLYVDGVAGSSGAAASPIVARSFEVVLGAREDDAGFADFWSGDLDEVRVWDRALPHGEVERLYDAER